MSTTELQPGDDGYDPTIDPRYPRIRVVDPDDEPQWPDGWGGEPTERDRAGAGLEHDTARGAADAGRVRSDGATRTTLHGAVNLHDYRPASAKGWGPGWPSCSGAGGQLVTVTANRSGARFSVHKRIAVLFDHLIDTMEGRGYLCKPPQSGAYNCRPIGGTKTPSNHSWGLATDVNWTDNPYTTTGRHTMPLWVPREVFGPYGFAWGGDYSGAKKDYMHLEFLGTPAQADEQTRRVVAPPPPPSGPRVLQLVNPHMTGDDVRTLQRVLASWYRLPASFVDGDFGPGTVEYVKRAQGATPPSPVLEADGKVGAATRAKLGIAA